MKAEGGDQVEDYESRRWRYSEDNESKKWR